MKPALLVLAAIVIILFMPAVMASINDFRADDYTELHIATTTSPDTSENVTLTQDLLNNSLVNVTVSSNNTNDAPLPALYTSATNVLRVDGLETDARRTLTVVYKIGALDDYVAADMGAKVWPTLIILGVFGVIAGAVYTSTKPGD